MASYYVRKSGSDSNAGTSAGAAWLTIGHAIASVARASGGDTIYVGAGTYREVNGAIVPAVSGTGVLTVLADCDGGHTGDSGPVVWTGYTTNDTSAPATTNPLLVLDNASYLTIQGFVCVGSGYTGGNSGSCFDTATTTSVDHITFRNCLFLPSHSGASNVVLWPKRDANTGCLFDSCVFMGAGGSASAPALTIFATNSAGTTDYDMGWRVTNCLFVVGASTIAIRPWGGVGSGSTGKPGGGVIRNCTAIGGVYGFFVSGWSSGTPCAAYNNVLWTEAGQDLRADTSGTFIEDYNLLMGQTARNNVTAGTHSQAGYGSAAFLLHLLQESWQGRAPRPMFSPMAGSPLLGFGNDAGAPATDFFGAPKPSGADSLSAAVGYSERGDTATLDGTTYHTAAPSAQLLGPGYQDVDLVVGGAATTVSVWCRYNAAADYATLPQALLLANAELGVTAQTLTAPSGHDATWEQLSFTAFTPTIPTGQTGGKVTIRLTNGVPSGTAAQANFDDIAVS